MNVTLFNTVGRMGSDRGLEVRMNFFVYARLPYVICVDVDDDVQEFACMYFSFRCS